MTPTPSPETKSTSRRALLAGALGGLAALAASAIGRPAVTRAEGQAIVVGGEYTDATSRTFLLNQTTVETVLEAQSAGGGIGVYGGSFSAEGVYGYSASGIGVSGDGAIYGVKGYSGLSVGVIGGSGADDGIQGQASTSDHSGVYGSNDGGGYGVAGSTSSGPSRAGVWGHNGSNGIGVRGTTISGAGVFGYSSSAPIPSAPTQVGVYGYAAQDATSRGVWGETTSGHGVHGTATTGFAGFFAGKVYVGKFQEMPEITAPSAPGANKLRLFARDNGSGKTQLCVRFPTGAVQVIKTEP